MAAHPTLHAPHVLSCTSACAQHHAISMPASLGSAAQCACNATHRPAQLTVVCCTATQANNLRRLREQPLPIRRDPSRRAVEPTQIPLQHHHVHHPWCQKGAAASAGQQSKPCITPDQRHRNQQFNNHHTYITLPNLATAPTQVLPGKFTYNRRIITHP